MPTPLVAVASADWNFWLSGFKVKDRADVRQRAMRIVQVVFMGDLIL